MAPTSVFVGERVIKPYELKTEDFPNLGQGYDFMTNEYKNKAEIKDVPSMVRTQENRTTAAWELSTMEEMRSSTESYSASAKAKAKLFGTKLDLSMAASGSWTKGKSGEKICARSVQRVSSSDCPHFTRSLLSSSRIYLMILIVRPCIEGDVFVVLIDDATI